MVKSLLLFALVCASSALHVSDSDSNSVQDGFHFRSWMTEHNKVYSTDEYHKRLQIFTENKRRIDQHNEGNHSYTMALNQFSDMTFAEFRNSFLWTTPQNCSATKGNYVRSNKLLPGSFDWRKEGNYVTDVKNQRNCGSCWSFSTTGCLESVMAIRSEKLIPLSEQQLVDCAQNFNNHGCNGGLPSQAFEYIRYSEGLMTEMDYPYKAVEGTCQYNPQRAAAIVKDVVNITEYREPDMMDAVVIHNPVSFAFEVIQDFMFYSQGVYTSTECHNTTDKVNHAVLAVGYSTDSDIPYWIVKNSWSSSWGMKGYFLIELGKNMCGLAACSSFPVV